MRGLVSRLPILTTLSLVHGDFKWIVVGKDDSTGTGHYTLRSAKTGFEHKAPSDEVHWAIASGFIAISSAQKSCKNRPMESAQ